MYPHPSNDNDYELDPNEPDYDHDSDSDCNIDLLLMTAGFDPNLIPEERRITALAVAQLWKDDVFAREEIEETLGHPANDIRKAVKALRIAARENVKVG
jgi:hypothetical protein